MKSDAQVIAQREKPMKRMWIGSALIALSAPTGVWAQAQSSSPQATGATANGALEDIVVTAQKKATGERAQAVPVTITAVSGDTLERKQIASLTELGQSIPNVAMDQAASIKGTANFSVRGLGISSSLPTLESATGVFVDGVYLASTQGVLLDMFDLDGIEVLRGPQGTLFGKNVTGGAVLIHNRAPTDHFELRARASVESGPEYKGGISIAGPLATDLKARVSALYDRDEGWFHNDFNNQPIGRSRTRLVKGAVEWTPGALDNILRAEYGRSTGDGAVDQNPAFYSRQGFTVNQDFVGYSDAKWWSVTNETNLDVAFGDGKLTNIAAYRRVDTVTAADIDGTPFKGFNNTPNVQVKQFSDELRYAGHVASWLDLTVGAYYFWSGINLIETRYLVTVGSDRTYGGDQTEHMGAVFAQGDVKFSDKLILTLGGRYSSERKRADVAVFSAAGSTCNPVTRACTYAFPDLGGKWHSFSPKAGLQYKVNRDVQFYASASKAYRAGGFNIRVTSPTQQNQFNQEQTVAFEIGGKADLFDHRLRTNFALFQNNTKHLIADVSIASASGGGTIQDTRNAGNVRAQGVEFEAVAQLTKAISLNASVGYQHAKFTKIDFSLFDAPGEPVGTINGTDLALKLPRVSPWSYSVGATLAQPVGAGRTLRGRVSWSYRDKAFNNYSNTAYLNTVQSLDANLGLSFHHDEMSVTVYGRNLTNHAYQSFTSVIPTVFFPPITTGIPPGSGLLEKGRVVGVELGLKL